MSNCRVNEFYVGINRGQHEGSVEKFKIQLQINSNVFKSYDYAIQTNLKFSPSPKNTSLILGLCLNNFNEIFKNLCERQ